MEYDEDEFLMLSRIQHYAFCPKQWALIELEQVWADNLLTVEGDYLHEKCHDAYVTESRGKVFISRAMPIFSYSLGVSGECDVVEFREDTNGISLPNKKGRFSVYPIEYKHGEPKNSDIDAVQLAAQAMCLEEMLLCEIQEGAIFYEKTRKRQKVAIDESLRNTVKKMLSEMHEYVKNGYVPKVKPRKGCNSCSLKNLCVPKLYKCNDVQQYIKQNILDE